MAVLEGEEKEEPVEGIGGSGLGLSEEGLAGPEVWVPEGEASDVPLLRLHLEPGEDLLGEVGAAHPLELVGESQLPVETGDAEEERGGDSQAASRCGRSHSG